MKEEKPKHTHKRKQQQKNPKLKKTTTTKNPTTKQNNPKQTQNNTHQFFYRLITKNTNQKIGTGMHFSFLPQLLGSASLANCSNVSTSQ